MLSPGWLSEFYMPKFSALVYELKAIGTTKTKAMSGRTKNTIVKINDHWKYLRILSELIATDSKICRCSFILFSRFFIDSSIFIYSF